MAKTHAQQIIDRLRKDGILPPDPKIAKKQAADNAAIEAAALANGYSQPPVPPAADLEFEVIRDVDNGHGFNRPNWLKDIADVEKQLGRPVTYEEKANAISPIEIARLESELGRSMTRDEKYFGKIAQPYTPPQSFAPILANGAEDPLDATIRDYEMQVEQEALSRMTDNEANLFLARKSKAEKIAQAEANKVLANHLASVRPQLDALETLFLKLQSTPLATNEDKRLVDVAIKQIRTPGHDVEVANILLNQVNQIAPRHLQEQRDGLANHLAKSGLNQDEIAPIVEKRFPTQETKAITTAKQSADNGKSVDWSKVSELETKYDAASVATQEALKAWHSTPKADTEAHNAAFVKWKTAAATQNAIGAEYFDASNGVVAE